MINKLFLIFSLLLITSNCFCQNPSDTIFLSYSGIRDIAIHKNSLWAIVQKGLIKVDSKTEKTTFYNRSNLNLPTENLRFIEVENDSTIWLGTYYNGIYKMVNNRLQHFTTENSLLPSNSISSLKLGPDKTLWIGTFKGIVKMNKDKFELLPSSPEAIFFYFISKNEFWCGTYDSGLWHYLDSNWEQFSKYNSSLPDNSVRHFLIDKESRKWVGTDKGLCIFEGKGLKHLAHKYFDSESIMNLKMTKEGEVLFTTYSGLNTIINDSIVPYKTVNTKLNGKNIYILKSDKKENIWLDENLTIYTPANNIQQNESLPSNYIRKIKVTENNTVWVGTYGNGVAQYKHGKWKNFTSKNCKDLGNYIDDIIIDKEQNIWVSSRESSVNYSNKIVKFDGEKWSSFPAKSDHFVIDFEKNIWFVDNDELYYYNPKFDTTIKAKFNIDNFMVNPESLSINSKGEVWVSSAKVSYYDILHIENIIAKPKGVAKISINDTIIKHETYGRLGFKLNDIFFTTEDEPYGYFLDYIYKFENNHWEGKIECPHHISCAAFDLNNTLWVGTYDYGVMKYKHGKWITYTTENSLILNNDIRTIAVDKNNNIWVGNSTGLTCLKNE